MGEIKKTKNFGLGLPEHFDPSVDKMSQNMELIDSALFKSIPSTVSSLNFNTALETGTYLIKSNALGTPNSSTSYNYSVVVFAVDNSHVYQIARSMGNSLMYYRYKNGASSFGSWYKIWNSANDGSGSGLDADLLDNLHSSSFYRKDYVASDFNSATNEGKYRINSSNNAPYTGCTDWVCLVYHLSGGTSELYQIAMEECYYSNTSISGGTTTQYTHSVPMVFVRKRYSSTWYSWQLLWHSGNDGSGSGLNADKLDGKHASEFAQTNTTAYADFNSVPLVAGMYGANGDATNAPVSSAGTYTVIVTKTSAGYMMLAINTFNSKIYRRHTIGDWSSSTTWSNVGGTGLHKATAIFVTSTGVEDITSNYLKVTRKDPFPELKAGDIIDITMEYQSSSTLTDSYLYTVDNLDFFNIPIYKPDGSTQVQPVQIPKYFLLEYNGSTFNIVSPLSDSNFVISENEPPDTSNHPTGTVWFRYYFDN